MTTLYVPSTGKSIDQSKKDQVNFADLAKAQGWSKEDLRKCYDIPKKIPPEKIVRMPADVDKDPFINKKTKTAEEEYNALEARFYNNLSRVTINPNKTLGRSASMSGTESRVSGNRIQVQIAGGQTKNVHLHVEKNSVDADVKL